MVASQNISELKTAPGVDPCGLGRLHGASKSTRRHQSGDGVFLKACLRQRIALSQSRLPL